jgi:D-tyrosyl-tRNA(Tyr) deacylase
MKIVLQRVSRAGVIIENKLTANIGKGYLILLGVSNADTEKNADKLADKISKLRIFEDENSKTNLSIADVDGEVLIVSQFTLYVDCKKGNRPSFANAGSPDEAKRLYEYFIKICKNKFKKVEHGVFGASMRVELTNDGPFTIVLEDE